MKNKPREGSRDIREGILISVYPDFCRLPGGAIVPYIVVAHQSDDGNTAPTVRMTGKRSHTTGSVILRCHGDEAGQGGGVKSGTVGGACQPKTHSQTVRIEGEYAVRHDDEWWMNNKNTIGKMQWIAEPSTQPPTPPLRDAPSSASSSGESGDNGDSGDAAVVSAAATMSVGALAPALPGWPARPQWPPLPEKSPSLNRWWAKATPMLKKGTASLARGVGARALPFIGELAFPPEMGDGTLSGALRRERDAIFQQVQDWREAGVSESQVKILHDQAWDKLYQSRPVLFEAHVWDEVFPKPADQAEDETQDQAPPFAITADNVRVTSREDTDEDRPCFADVVVSRSMSPESAKHIEDAQAIGYPHILTIDRPGAAARRKLSLHGIPTISGFDRDEYPPAMFREGGAGASIRHVPLADNRSAGAQIGNQLRNRPEGCRVTILTGP